MIKTDSSVSKEELKAELAQKLAALEKEERDERVLQSQCNFYHGQIKPAEDRLRLAIENKEKYAAIGVELRNEIESQLPTLEKWLKISPAENRWPKGGRHNTPNADMLYNHHLLMHFEWKCSFIESRYIAPLREQLADVTAQWEAFASQHPDLKPDIAPEA